MMMMMWSKTTIVIEDSIINVFVAIIGPTSNNGRDSNDKHHQSIHVPIILRRFLVWATRRSFLEPGHHLHLTYLGVAFTL